MDDTPHIDRLSLAIGWLAEANTFGLAIYYIVRYGFSGIAVFLVTGMFGALLALTYWVERQKAAIEWLHDGIEWIEDDEDSTP